MTLEEAYRELGLAPGAESEAVAGAYRALCRKYHPDVAGAAGAQRMKRVTEAYAKIQEAPAGDPGPHPWASSTSTRPSSTPRRAAAPTCADCGAAMYQLAREGGFLDPVVRALCPSCRAGWGMWRLVSFAVPWIVLGLLIARFAGLPLREASWIAYPLAAIPVGVLLWRPLTATRAGSGLRGLATRRRAAWAARAPLTLLLGLVGAPFLVLDAAVVTALAIRAGGGRDSSYLRRRWDSLGERLEASVRGWLRPAS